MADTSSKMGITRLMIRTMPGRSMMNLPKKRKKKKKKKTVKRRRSRS